MKVKWKWIALLLLIINTGLSTALLLGPPRPDRKPHMRIEERFEDEFELNAEQMDQIRQEIDGHRRQSRHLQEQINQQRRELMTFIADPNDSTARKLSQEIGQMEARKERMILMHFHRMRAIIPTTHHAEFDRIIQELLTNPRRPGPPPGQRGVPPRRGR